MTGLLHRLIVRQRADLQIRRARVAPPLAAAVHAATPPAPPAPPGAAALTESATTAQRRRDQQPHGAMPKPDNARLHGNEPGTLRARVVAAPPDAGHSAVARAPSDRQGAPSADVSADVASIASVRPDDSAHMTPARGGPSAAPSTHDQARGGAEFNSVSRRRPQAPAVTRAPKAPLPRRTVLATPPPVQVTIGTIEVRASMPAPVATSAPPRQPPAGKPRAKSPSLTLDHYLAQRKQGSR